MKRKRGDPPSQYPVWRLLGQALEVFPPSFLIFSVGPWEIDICQSSHVWQQHMSLYKTFHSQDTQDRFLENSSSWTEEHLAEKCASFDFYIKRGYLIIISCHNKDDSWFDKERQITRAGSLWHHMEVLIKTTQDWIRTDGRSATSGTNYKVATSYFFN